MKLVLTKFQVDDIQNDQRKLTMSRKHSVESTRSKFNKVHGFGGSLTSPSELSEPPFPSTPSPQIQNCNFANPPEHPNSHSSSEFYLSTSINPRLPYQHQTFPSEYNHHTLYEPSNLPTDNLTSNQIQNKVHHSNHRHNQQSGLIPLQSTCNITSRKLPNKSRHQIPDEHNVQSLPYTHTYSDKLHNNNNNNNNNDDESLCISNQSLCKTSNQLHQTDCDIPDSSYITSPSLYHSKLVNDVSLGSQIVDLPQNNSYSSNSLSINSPCSILSDKTCAPILPTLVTTSNPPYPTTSPLSQCPGKSLKLLVPPPLLNPLKVDVGDEVKEDDVFYPLSDHSRNIEMDNTHTSKSNLQIPQDISNVSTNACTDVSLQKLNIQLIEPQKEHSYTIIHHKPTTTDVKTNTQSTLSTPIHQLPGKPTSPQTIASLSPLPQLVQRPNESPFSYCDNKNSTSYVFRINSTHSTVQQHNQALPSDPSSTMDTEISLAKGTLTNETSDSTTGDHFSSTIRNVRSLPASPIRQQPLTPENVSTIQPKFTLTDNIVSTSTQSNNSPCLGDLIEDSNSTSILYPSSSSINPVTEEDRLTALHCNPRVGNINHHDAPHLNISVRDAANDCITPLDEVTSRLTATSTSAPVTYSKLSRHLTPLSPRLTSHNRCPGLKLTSSQVPDGSCFSLSSKSPNQSPNHVKFLSSDNLNHSPSHPQFSPKSNLVQSQSSLQYSPSVLQHSPSHPLYSPKSSPLSPSPSPQNSLKLSPNSPSKLQHSPRNNLYIPRTIFEFPDCTDKGSHVKSERDENQISETIPEITSSSKRTRNKCSPSHATKNNSLTSTDGEERCSNPTKKDTLGNNELLPKTDLPTLVVYRNTG